MSSVQVVLEEVGEDEGKEREGEEEQKDVLDGRLLSVQFGKGVVNLTCSELIERLSLSGDVRKQFERWVAVPKTLSALVVYSAHVAEDVVVGSGRTFTPFDCSIGRIPGKEIIQSRVRK